MSSCLHTMTDAVVGRTCLFIAVAVLLATSACDDVPTFQELTGEAVDGNAPEQAVPDQPLAAPPVVPEMPEPVARTPQQIIDEFLASDTRLRSNAQLEELAGFDKEILKQLTVLDLNGSQVNDQGALHIAKLQAVEELDISGTAVTNEGMPQIGKAKGLRKVYLDRMIIDGEGLKALADHEQMVELSLANTPISDAAFKHLRKMNQLEVLRVSGIRSLQGHGFNELVKNKVFNNLRELQASGTSFGYYGLRNLKNMPALETLIVADAEVGEQSLTGIAGCRNLKVLDISRNPIGDSSLKLLARLKNLEVLKVNGCVGVSSEGLNHLKGLKTLKHLDLTGCRCSPADVKTLKEKFLKDTEIRFNNEVF